MPQLDGPLTLSNFFEFQNLVRSDRTTSLIVRARIFGHPRFLLCDRNGAQTEMSLAVIAYNLKRMINVLGGRQLNIALATG